MGPECSNFHKGIGLCIIAKGHPYELHRVLNNTEVKERNSTKYIYICVCVCIGVCVCVCIGVCVCVHVCIGYIYQDLRIYVV